MAYWILWKKKTWAKAVKSTVYYMWLHFSPHVNWYSRTSTSTTAIRNRNLRMTSYLPDDFLKLCFGCGFSFNLTKNMHANTIHSSNCHQSYSLNIRWQFEQSSINKERNNSNTVCLIRNYCVDFFASKESGFAFWYSIDGIDFIAISCAAADDVQKNRILIFITAAHSTYINK